MIIFLDIDGVLATVKQFNLTHNSKTWIHKYNCYPFDSKCVRVFNEILEKTDADIVISSDWRLYYTLEELSDIFKINGVVKSPIDITPYHKTSALRPNIVRGNEILEYVHDNIVDDWIAIDDMDMYYWLGDHFFMCNSEWEGIKQSGLKEKILNYLL